MDETESTPTRLPALHPAILRSYQGTLHGEDAHGVHDIRFPSLHHATMWALVCDVSDRVWLRPDSRDRQFNQPVVIQLGS